MQELFSLDYKDKGKRYGTDEKHTEQVENIQNRDKAYRKMKDI